MGVPILQLFGYSVVAFGLYGCDILNNMMLQTFLLDYALLSPTWVGLIGTVSQGVEIVSSILTGKLSDHTKSRYGKRRPWLLGGSILTSGAILCLFIIVPHKWSEAAKVIYYMGIVLWYSTVFPATTIPHQTLGAEIASDYDKRLRYGTWAMAMTFAGQLCLIVFLFLLFTFKVDEVVGGNVWLVLAAFPALTTLVFGIVSFCTIENSIDKEKSGTNIARNTCLKSIKIFSIPSFIITVLIFALVNQISSICLSLLPLYIKHTVGFGLDTFSQLAIVMSGSTVLTIYALHFFGRYFEKNTLLNFGCILGCIAYLGFFFIPGEEETTQLWTRYWVFPLSALAGVASAITYSLPGTMMADVTDVAFLRFKSKQEGFMFSVMETIQSIIQAVAGFLIGLRLDAVGYVSTGEQPAQVKLELRFLFCTIPIAVYLVVWLLGVCYPITRKRHCKILEDIRQLDDVDLTDDTGFFALSPVSIVGNLDYFDDDEIMRLKKSKYNLIQHQSSRNLQALPPTEDNHENTAIYEEKIESDDDNEENNQ